MSTSTGHVMNLANSIIGVSVLAMPFCFKQCGITLAILMLILSSITTRLACHFLVKSSSMCKRRNFEFLAFYTFGPSGKLLVELGIIGFMMGTCVAFFVVIGDLGPEIISKVFSVKNDSTLRSIVLLGLGLCVVLPLGLLRNIESLGAISTVTIGFYFLLIVKIFLESFSHLLAGDWMQQVNFWQPQGVLQCIPIFAMALSCQTQIFEIYETLPVPTLDKMNSVVRSAVNMCTVVYICVGFLGYIAFCTRNFSGNILLSFAPSMASEMYKLGFVMSLAVSFPLVIFPCRASLYSLLFKRMPVHHELSQTNSHIPDMRFKCLTVAIVMVSLVTGLIIPSIELVLGFVGSTIGVAICVIFPSLSFINLTTKETNERLTAKVTLIIGIMIMVTGSVANLEAATNIKIQGSSSRNMPDINIFPEYKLPGKNVVSTESARIIENKINDLKTMNSKKKLPEKPAIYRKPSIVQNVVISQKKEPPFPVPPVQEISQSEKPVISPLASLTNDKKYDTDKNINAGNDVIVNKLINEAGKPVEDNINKDAIEKEEREMQQMEHEKKKEEKQKEEELLQKLKEHEKEQNKLLQEQQKILIKLKNMELEKNKSEKKDEKQYNKPHAGNGNLIQTEEPNKKVEMIQNVVADIRKNEMENEKVVKNEKPSEQSSNVEAMPLAPVASNDKASKNSALKPQVASIPLPLVKYKSNVENSEKEIVKTKHKSKQDVMRRDILENSQQNSILEREKRNIHEAISNPDKFIKTANFNECAAKNDTDKTTTLNAKADKTEIRSKETVVIKKNSEKPEAIMEGMLGQEILIKNLQHVSIDHHVDKGLTLRKQQPNIITGESSFSASKKDI